MGRFVSPGETCPPCGAVSVSEANDVGRFVALRARKVSIEHEISQSDRWNEAEARECAQKIFDGECPFYYSNTAGEIYRRS